MSKEFVTIKGPSKIRFMSYCGDRQGCGTIRVIYPTLLINMYRDVKNQYVFEADYTTSFINDPNFYKTYTFVQFQRSATDQHLKIFQHYVKNIKPHARVPIVYELDDCLQDIPNWNYASGYYNNNTQPVYDMLKMVDGMTTSTEELKTMYSKYCNNIVVIPNHLPKFIWGEVNPKHLKQPRELKDRPRIGWAGSENHFCNVKSEEFKKGIRGGDFGTKLLDFIRKTTDKYQWVLSGACPVELNDIKDKIETHGWVDIFNYPNHLKKLDLDIAIAPLMPCSFNNCKSEIKVLEYTTVGVPGVYSSSSPYKNTMLNSNDEDCMIGWIEKLAEDLDFRKKVFETDYNTVKENLFWEDNNNLKKYVNSYLSLFKRKLAD